jgi:hypothetical protein
MGEKRNAYRISTGKAKRKRPLRRPGWEHAVEMGLTGVGRNGINWIHLAQDRNQ